MTGERMVTSFDNHFGKYEHLHRYAVALEFANNLNVLDVACGEGYGTNLLSHKAKFVTGIDVSIEAIVHARNKYKNLNINFKQGLASKLPCEDNQFDLVVSFETIEHLIEHDLMFKEIKRVLRNEGMLIISSPEKNLYHQRDSENIFHLKELTLNELLLLAKTFFKHSIILKQFIAVGSIIIPVSDIKTKFITYKGDFDSISTDLPQYDFFNVPFFNIILCSDSEINPLEYSISSVFDAYPVYKYYLDEKDRDLFKLKSEMNKLYSSKLYKLLKKIRRLKNSIIKIPS